MLLDSWKGRSFDLGRMTFGELLRAYVTYYAIQVYAALSVLGLAATVWLAEGWVGPLVAAAAIVVLYPVVWYLLHRFVLHGHFLYKWQVTAAVCDQSPSMPRMSRSEKAR